MADTKRPRMHREDVIQPSQCAAPAHHYRFVQVTTVDGAARILWLHDYPHKCNALMAAFLSHDGDSAFQVFDHHGRELTAA